MYAFWNTVKGGSNTATMLMEDCKLYPPHINAKTVVSACCIMLVFVLNHRLFQLVTAKQDVTKYSSLLAWRKAASGRSTFHKSMLFCAKVLHDEVAARIERAEKENSGENSFLHTNNLRSRKNPSRRRVNGKVLQEVNWASIPSSR